MLAAYDMYLPIVSMLLQAGASTSSCDERGDMEAKAQETVVLLDTGKVTKFPNLFVSILLGEKRSRHPPPLTPLIYVFFLCFLLSLFRLKSSSKA
jgi:hypothetical protein